MGFSQDYPNVPDWISKSEGYQTGAMCKYQGNIFYANFWASEPGVGDADHNGWRFYDELYDLIPHTPTDQAKIIAYIPTWRKKEGFNYANDEMYQHITHGIIAFLTFSETNLGKFDPSSINDVNAILSDVVNTGHRNGTSISIALGGANDYGFLNLMTSVGNNPANPLLDRAVQNAVTFVNSNHLDGVDLDLECWWGKPGEKDQGGRSKSDEPHPAGRGLALFAQKLKQAMPDKLVSAAVFGTSWYGNNYDPKMADYLDWLGVMTYDLTGSWNASPVGPHTALLKIRDQASSNIRAQEAYQESYLEEQQGEWPGGGIINNPILSVEDMLWYWTNPLFVNWQGAGQKIPRNKIAAGVPLYGYDFAYGKEPDDLSGQVPPGYKVIRYKDILAQFPDANTAAHGNIKVPGSTPRPPFISASGNYPYAHNIYFETPDTAVAKLNFLKTVGAQGVIIWELSNDVWEDNKSVIKALYQNSGNPKKEISIALSLVEANNTIKLAAETATGQWANTYQVCFPFNIGGRSFVFGHKNKKSGTGLFGQDIGTTHPGWWFIQELLPDGKMGAETATGQWKNAYGVCFPFNIEGRSFIFGHKISNEEGGNVPPGWWFIQELLPDGKMGAETATGQWANTYQVCFPFNIGGRSFVFGHKNEVTGTGLFGQDIGTTHPGYWFIQELVSGISSKDWILLQGNNSYCYCVCNRASTNHQEEVSTSHTMMIEAGAPYLYAVLTKDDDSVDFPTGARMTVQAPDGINYDHDIQDENQLVIMSGDSVRCLIVKDPKPGNWTMTMDVPAGVGFHCECNTVPSTDVYDTIIDTLDNSLQKRDLSGAIPSFSGFLGLTAITIMLPETALLGTIGAVVVVGLGLAYQALNNTQKIQKKKAIVSQVSSSTGKTVGAKRLRQIASITTQKKEQTGSKLPGLFTWNMQGSNWNDIGNATWYKVRDWFKENSEAPYRITVACLQECGSPPATAGMAFETMDIPDNAGIVIGSIEKYFWPGGERDELYLSILFYQWDTGGNRVNLSIVSATSLDNVEYFPGHLRPLIGIQNGGIYFFTIHAASGAGGDAWPLLRDVNQQIHLPWWVVGDYNQDPNVLEGRLMNNNIDVTICPPNNVTRPASGNMLDYAVRNANANQVQGQVIPGLGAGVSDHLPVFYQL